MVQRDVEHERVANLRSFRRCTSGGRPLITMSPMWRVLVPLALCIVPRGLAQEPPNMHELECAIHTFAHAYGVSKVCVFIERTQSMQRH